MYAICLCYKGLGDNHKSVNLVKNRKCSVDEDLKRGGWRRLITMCICNKGLGGKCRSGNQEERRECSNDEGLNGTEG